LQLLIACCLLLCCCFAVAFAVLLLLIVVFVFAYLPYFALTTVGLLLLTFTKYVIYHNSNNESTSA
jgi:hypothetical protein